MNSSIKFVNLIKRSSTFTRRIILIFFDLLAILASLFLTIWFTSNKTSFILNKDYIWLLVYSLLLGLFLLYFSGQYRSLTKHVGSKLLYQIALRNFLLVFILYWLNYFFNFSILIFKQWLLFWFFLTASIGFSKFFLRDILIKFFKVVVNKKYPYVVIYGAGAAGAQLAKSLKLSGDCNLSFFVDDNQNLWHRSINGVNIYPPSYIKKRRNYIDQILIAIPSITTQRRLEIIEKINNEGIQVKIIPSLGELISGKAKINSLRSIELNDLLGREPVNPDTNLIGKSLKKSNICITGAGGSIGSQLAREILNLDPQKLILIEQNELSLYNLSKELDRFNKNNIEIKSFLGDTSEILFIDNLFKQENINIIFHAAAYKHVPIVENNPLVGLYNNIASTHVLAEASKKYSLSHFVLISSDKAVRPTNIMGCSKRVSELVIQAYSQINSKTNFSMVRFGNVIGSSGSVVPLFIEQISKGGPITLTHPEITRYFMSIVEACQLVLQVVEISNGGELFLLDMGHPVKIIDLAKKIISLSGLKMKNKSNPDGDIEILTTGLRPGEKLFEELLIDAEATPTIHPLIYKAVEKSIPSKEFLAQLDKLENSLKNHNKDLSFEILENLVPEWKGLRP